MSKLRSVGDAGKRQRLRQSILGGLGDLPDVLFQVLRVYRSLVDLNDVAFHVDQKGCGNNQITVTVEQVTVQNVVNAGYIL